MMKTIAVKLPEQLIEGIDTAARTRGESRSALMRQALAGFIARPKQEKTGSCLDLARDLAGQVAGPPDLSVNKRHLDGYGQ